jgi:hypothetical protein
MTRRTRGRRLRRSRRGGMTSEEALAATRRSRPGLSDNEPRERLVADFVKGTPEFKNGTPEQRAVLLKYNLPGLDQPGVARGYVPPRSLPRIEEVSSQETAKANGLTRADGSRNLTGPAPSTPVDTSNRRDRVTDMYNKASLVRDLFGGRRTRRTRRTRRRRRGSRRA